ncbi:MAG TPA: cyanophycinase [Gemmatimonadaceae bacterium]|nr:cyanophycinase [Gemmatimonadaceae bacterium]
MKNGRKSPTVLLRVLIACLAIAGATQGCASAPAGAPPAASRGNLVIVGGGPIPEAITRRFVDLAGGRGKARIAVLPMASSVASTGPDKVAELRALGADAFVLNVKRPDADADSVVNALESASGIWFSGGDQSRIMTALGGTRAAAAIRGRYLGGAVIGGTSAGAAVMSATMITGDERRIGGDRPPSDSSQAYITIDRDNIVTTAGFGLIGGAIIDQHFVRRKRQNRLVSLVLENPAQLGVGIDESTAILVRPDGRWEVAGASVAVIFDARGGRVTPKGTTLGAAEVRMHVLPSGSVFDPQRGKVVQLGVAPPA